ncbi:hypothetical protein J5N97_023337 [Dioscorea zingiberensis]|uniref:RRM domain-containing protein n=1 Tax=Dioscorea zingiberensis TaxID=325984 RepID=A0A9D5CCX7_9LILI|nr:hypothetical protein J5N97_023337 [Dioscorea zingiberensis]
MAPSRLFQAELHLRNSGFVWPRRWWCSSASSPSPSKKSSKRSEAAKKKRTMAVKSFVQRYMLKYPGVFPKLAEVHGAVGGSWYILKEILSGMKAEMLPASQIDQQTASGSSYLVADTCEAKEVEGKMDSSVVNMPEGGFGTLTEMLDVAKYRLMEDKNPTVSVSVEIPNNFEELQSGEKQKTMQDSTTSGTVKNQLLFHPRNRIVGAGGETAVATDADSHSFKAKFPKDAFCPNRIEDSARRLGGMASNQDSLATKVASLTLDKRKLEPALSFVKIKASLEQSALCQKGSDLRENLKKPQDFRGDKEKSMKQDEYLKLKEIHSEGSGKRPEVTGLLARIMDPARDMQKTGPMANRSSNKTKIPNEEPFLENPEVSVHESLKHLSLNDKSTSLSQPEKRNVNNIPYEVIENESDSDISAFEYPSPERNDVFPPSAKRFGLNANQHDVKCAHKNSLLVYFLPKSAKVKDLIQTFGDSGAIPEIRILPSRENRFNYAFIFFKTEEGLRKALSKTNVAVAGADVATEASFAPSDMRDRMLCAEQVDNGDFPNHFLKDPRRTIIITGLPNNLSFHHLKGALSPLGRITGISMGTAVSTVFIEFESEESKERALAKATVSISGTTLSILRVDAPRTTVIRISNVNPVSGATKVHSICNSFGEVKRVATRYIDTFDVHFKLSEWPNMLKIINRLNGLVIDQNRWIAQPATLIPAEVLQALWNKPEGRKQVHELVRNLCKRISNESIDTSPLISLAEEFYGQM